MHARSLMHKAYHHAGVVLPPRTRRTATACLVRLSICNYSSSSSSPPNDTTPSQKRATSRTEKFLDPATNRDKFLVGTPHPVSNLRPVLYPTPSAAHESEADRQFREQCMRVDAFNQDFWVRNNALFNQAKADFEAKIQEKNGGAPVTTEEMSVFYKDFLDKAYDRQMAYNKQWWIENIGLLWPSAKAVFRKWTHRA